MVRARATVRVRVRVRVRVTLTRSSHRKYSPGRISAQWSVEKMRLETGGKKKKVMKRKTYLERHREI